MRFAVTVCATLAALLSPFCLAADADGRFAVKSAGGTKCSQFVEFVDARNPAQIALYVGWVAGYISASNQLEPDTFDLASWQARACQRANRNLTQEEWRTYIDPDVAYVPTCPDLPPGE